MIHPATELRFLDTELGFGVFATRPIPRGTIVWALCERERAYTPAEVAALDPAARAHLIRYCYVDADSNTVLPCDDGRYVNHSCDPATLGVGEYLEVAVRDLAPGDQITCDYALMNLPEALHCRCGSPRCRGTITGDDVRRHWPEWDDTLRRVAERWAEVPQPLLAHALGRPTVQGWLEGTIPVPSEYSPPLRHPRRRRSPARAADATRR